MLDALQFETEIKGDAIKTLEKIQDLLGKISQKTTINIDIQGIHEFQNFVKSEDFKNVAKNISSAFGGAKAKNVEQFFTNIRTEIEKVKISLKSDDYSAFINQIGQLTQKFNELSIAYQSFLKASNTKTGDDVVSDIQKRLHDVEKAISQLEPAYEKLKKKQDDLEKSQGRVTKKQEEIGKEMKKTTAEADKQSVSIQGLQNMMNRYLSVYAIGRFASEMAQITGELELQRRSLEVIIGNADKANELYSTIRDMSQMSPYTFQDLMKSTRQLSAFGIETRDLYDTMKALSDIGAGLSVDVQRLILAYGHTRSYGYLSGIQNRQFETAGIDMIGGLADYYNKLADAEERAGRVAERVTRKDVFKRMSKRDISFEDVNAVIMDLDREGGKFFNMQERQFETLGGQLRNLRNNYNIMMSEMGEQNKGILRAGVNLLNELTGNWQKYALVIKSLILPLGALKLALIAVNRASQENSLFSPIGRANVKKGFGNIVTSITAMVSSAATWITAALAAITSVVVHFRDMSKEAERVAKKMADSAQRSAEEIDRILQRYNGGAITIASDRKPVNNSEIVTNNIQFNRDAMRSLNLGYELEELKRKLQSMSPFYEGDLVDIFKLQTQEEQFEAIINKMEAYRRSDNLLTAYEDVFADSSKGGFWKGKDSFEENLKDYEKSIALMSKRLRNMREEGGLTIDMLNDFNNELDGILGDGSITSKAENLRKYFVDYLSLNDEDRSALYNSWSNGLKGVFEQAFGISITKQNKDRIARIKGSRLFGDDFRFMFGMDAFSRGRDLNYNWDQVASGLETALAGASSYEERIDAIRTRFNASTEGKNFTEEVLRYMFEALLRNVSNRLNNTDYEEFMRTEFQMDFGKRMETMVKNNPNWTKGQAFDAASGLADEVKQEWINAGRDVSAFWSEGFVDGLQTSAMSMVSVRQAWQEELQGAFKYTDEQGTDQWGYSDFYNAFANRIREAVESDDLGTFFGETMKKEHDDMAKSIENLFKPASKKWGINIEPDLKVKTQNLEQLKQVRDDIKQKLDTEGVLSPTAREGLEELYKELNKFVLLEDTAKKYGFEYGDDKKSGYGSGYHDEYAKRWDERIRIMKEAYDWYDKWDKKVGEEEAFKKVDERYRDIFDEWKTDKIVPFDFKATDIKDYFKYVEDIRNQALAKYQQQKNDESKGYGQEALRVYRQAVATLEEGGYDNFVKAAEKFQSIMEKTMDDLQRRWSLFTDIRDKTGNVGLAATLSGVDTSFRTQADAMRAAVQNAYTEAGGKGEVTFDISLDKDAIRAMFEGAIRGDKTDAKYMESIDGLIKGFEEWQKSEEEQEKMDINVTVDLLSSAVDLQSEVQKIVTNYNSQLDSLNRQFPNGGETYNQAKGILDTNTQNKLVQAQEAYKLLMDGVITMNIAAARDVREAYVNTLNRQLAAGAITAKEYADQIDAINDRMQALENLQSFQRSYMEQGVSGATDNLAQRGKSLIEQGAAIMEKGSQTMNSEMVKMGQYMIQTGQGMKKASQNMNQTVAIISLIVNGINNMVQSLKGVWDEINSTLQAYGDDTQKYGMGRKVGTFLSSFAEASQGATDAFEALKSGNGGGVLLGVVKSWTSWFRGFAKGNDEENALYRANAESAIKNYGNIHSSLQSDKERSFGYAQMGSYGLRGIANARYNEKILRSFYGRGNWSDATLEAMTSALQSGSAYAGEYATLMAELDSRQNQLSSLESDKDKDQDEIEATKKQIAELEDQIAHFTEDLAKDLWGIDVKSWADQINDALMNAFENGEDAAKAYQDTVRSIMQNVTSQIMKMSIIQPMMEKLQKILFGTKDEKGNLQGGVVSTDDLIKDPTGAAKKLVQASNQFFANEGNAMITAAREFYEGMNTGLGGILTNPNANTLSSSIQGTAEETSDLLAGYVSTLRQDVAAERILREQFITEIWPTFVEETMNAVIQPLNQINLNVLAIRQSMTGQGELITAIDDIYSILNAITNGTKEVHMA